MTDITRAEVEALLAGGNVRRGNLTDHAPYIARAYLAKCDEAERAEALEAALEILAEETTADEIPGGYIPPESPDWHRGYDAAIRKARAALEAANRAGEP